MKLRLLLPAFVALSGIAWACGGGMEEPGYTLRSMAYDIGGTAMLAPGNDSRVNLALLAVDQRGMSTAGLKLPTVTDYDDDDSPIFFAWNRLRGALTRVPPGDAAVETPPYAGTRCAGFAAGSAALAAAMAANGAVPAAERAALIQVRADGEAVCKDAGAWERNYGVRKGSPIMRTTAWPAIASPAGQEFLAYIQATDAFYAEQFAIARTGFAGLARAHDPYLRETAAYMMIRAEFAAAQAPAFDEYGSYDVAKVDHAAAQRGLAAMAAYLKDWPAGRYAASARALHRRGLWLTGDQASLAGI